MFYYLLGISIFLSFEIGFLRGILVRDFGEKILGVCRSCLFFFEVNYYLVDSVEFSGFL